MATVKKHVDVHYWEISYTIQLQMYGLFLDQAKNISLGSYTSYLWKDMIPRKCVYQSGIWSTSELTQQQMPPPAPEGHARALNAESKHIRMDGADEV